MDHKTQRKLLAFWGQMKANSIGIDGKASKMTLTVIAAKGVPFCRNVNWTESLFRKASYNCLCTQKNVTKQIIHKPLSQAIFYKNETYIEPGKQ